ncbi:SDR family oxidoreductase [Microlunatus flavus]|uniref:NAD(P)-dependent dehydrogenase, short-chain alcohol dehydrogenase family n=1 Tax=Microlunatus flavus TaxID=1036181 RepID=A0A1H9KT48_9ACTN|nr:SDR family oxidoreductase [Microlunatus flavus]SER02302.1 NAD(P)-dependent dehydrogenase, short-chain alcohol dehydrogenase family [Microlunatus flavus]
MGQLENKTALITGGASGIGLATARRFVAEGAHVFITGRRQAELDQAAQSLGPNATAVRGDVSDLGDLDRVFDAVRERGRGLDVLFANAGGGAYATLEDLTPEEFDQTFTINVRGTVFTVQKALPLLTEGASVIVTGSTTASKGVPAFGVYAATKAALGSFTRTWAGELSGRGIRVNAIVPGPTDTPGLRGLAAGPEHVAQLLGQMAQGVPLGRVAATDEIASAVLFLASDQSSFVTGSELFADGGEVHV